MLLLNVEPISLALPKGSVFNMTKFLIDDRAVEAVENKGWANVTEIADFLKVPISDVIMDVTGIVHIGKQACAIGGYIANADNGAFICYSPNVKYTLSEIYK